MRLWQRYRQLNVWNKLGTWGNVASIAALPLTAVGVVLGFLTLWPTHERPTPIRITRFEFYEPKVGEVIAANAHYKASAPALRVSGNATLFLLTPHADVQTDADWERGLQHAWTLAVGRWTEVGPERVVPEGIEVYFTVPGPLLTDANVRALLAGSSALFFAGRLNYSGDNRGAVEFCVFFKGGAKFLCPAHNGPVAVHAR